MKYPNEYYQKARLVKQKEERIRVLLPSRTCLAIKEMREATFRMRNAESLKSLH